MKKEITNIIELKAEITRIRQVDIAQKKVIQQDIEKIKDLFDPITDFVQTARSGIKKVKNLFGGNDSNEDNSKINHSDTTKALKTGAAFLVPYLANKFIFKGQGGLIKSAATYLALNFLSNKAEKNADGIVETVSNFVDNIIHKKPQKEKEEFKFGEKETNY